jgi:hypothetical protein
MSNAKPKKPTPTGKDAPPLNAKNDAKKEKKTPKDKK